MQWPGAKGVFCTLYRQPSTALSRAGLRGLWLAHGREHDAGHREATVADEAHHHGPLPRGAAAVPEHEGRGRVQRVYDPPARREE